MLHLTASSEIFLNSDGAGTFMAAPTAYAASTFGGVTGDSFYPLDIQMFDLERGWKSGPGVRE